VNPQSNTALSSTPRVSDMFVTQIDLAMIRMRTNVKRNEKNCGELKALIKGVKEFRETIYSIKPDADAVKKEDVKAKAKRK
jgi:hypothetical protein